MVDYILGSLRELLAAIQHTSLQGRVGMGLIGVYFVIIVVTALYRIRKGDHLHH